MNEILSRIFLNLARRLKNKKVGVLFSGGVDSSLIAKYASDYGLNPALYSFGTTKSRDKNFALRFADEFETPLVYEELGEKGLSEHINVVKQALQEETIEPNPMQVALAIGVYIIGKKAAKDGVQVMLNGLGSDTLLAGYKKYEGLSDSELRKQIQENLTGSAEIDKKRDEKMLALSDITLISPYMESEFVGCALDIPKKFKIRGGVSKYILRQLAKEKGLPDYIVERPRQALQYSTGLQKTVTKILKSEERL